MPPRVSSGASGVDDALVPLSVIASSPVVVILVSVNAISAASVTGFISFVLLLLRLLVFHLVFFFLSAFSRVSPNVPLSLIVISSPVLMILMLFLLLPLLVLFHLFFCFFVFYFVVINLLLHFLRLRFCSC